MRSIFLALALPLLSAFHSHATEPEPDTRELLKNALQGVAALSVLNFNVGIHSISPDSITKDRIDSLISKWRALDMPTTADVSVYWEMRRIYWMETLITDRFKEESFEMNAEKSEELKTVFYEGYFEDIDRMLTSLLNEQALSQDSTE